MKIGRSYPKFEVHGAVKKDLERLGYLVGKLPKRGAVVIDIDQMTVNAVNDAPKDVDEYEVSFLLDVMTRSKSNSQEEAYNAVANIRANMNIKLDNYVIQNDVLYEDSISIQEIDEQGEIQREEQRVILTLTKKL